MQDVDMWRAGFSDRLKRPKSESFHVVRDNEIWFLGGDDTGDETFRIRMIQVNQMPQHPLPKRLGKIGKREVEITRPEANHSSSRFQFRFQKLPIRRWRHNQNFMPGLGQKIRLQLDDPFRSSSRERDKEIGEEDHFHKVPSIK